MFGKSKSGKQGQLTIAEVLHGAEAGRLQSVGYMQVIPLTSDLVDDRFVSPAEGGAEVSTTDYGTLVFQNPSPAVLIVPCHAGYVVKQAAQDHAMTHAAVVRSSQQRSFGTAACIEQTQGGLIQRGSHQMLILPFALRERALEVRHEQSYNKLWQAIAAFNESMGVRGASHLDFFLKQFRRELDEFVAEFECVDRQVGAIILVDDQVVGIERAPSHAYWRSVWPCLIRECYGSLALQAAQMHGEHAPPPASRVPLPEAIESLDQLESVVADVAAEEDRRTKDRVRELLDVPLTTVVDEAAAGLTTETIAVDRFAGQVIRDSKRVVYASIVASKRWLADQQWRAAKPFSI